MKRAAFFHGTSNTLNDVWYPWLIGLLKTSGYEVYSPILPDNNRPNKDTYEKFLRESGWDFSDNLIVGHSSGATEILNLMQTDWFPHVETAVLVSTFLNEKLVRTASWYTPGQFDNTFLPSYDPTVIKTKADRFYFVHGSDDHNCDIDDAKALCEAVGGTFITVPNGGHLGMSSGLKTLPELEIVLRRDRIVL